MADFAAIAEEFPRTEFAAKALYQMAMIQHRQYYDLDQAVQILEKVLAESAAPPALRTDVRLRLGEIFVARADTVRAAEAFTGVASLPSSTPDQSDEARLHLAELAFFNGRIADAMGMLDSISVNSSMTMQMTLNLRFCSKRTPALQPGPSRRSAKRSSLLASARTVKRSGCSRISSRDFRVFLLWKTPSFA
jgi:hypothetical protein